MNALALAITTSMSVDWPREETPSAEMPMLTLPCASEPVLSASMWYSSICTSRLLVHSLSACTTAATGPLPPASRVRCRDA